MRYLVTATMAASVFAIGLRMGPAASLPLVDRVASPDTAIQNVQQRGDRDRERGYRGDRDRDRDGRRSGRGGFGIEIGPGYFGYRSGGSGGCGELRRRAVETDSPYWWRRYRACRDD